MQAGAGADEADEQEKADDHVQEADEADKQEKADDEGPFTYGWDETTKTAWRASASNPIKSIATRMFRPRGVATTSQRARSGLMAVVMMCRTSFAATWQRFKLIIASLQARESPTTRRPTA